MNRHKLRLLIVLGAIVLTSVGFFFLRDGDVGEAQGRVLRYKELPVRLGTFLIRVSASGEVKPIDRIEIKSKASGTVVELPVEEGDTIKKGDLIARLDQKDEKAEFEQAQANLDIAQAELKQAQRQFDRRDQLFKKGLISEEELGEIELNLAVARGKLVQARTALERATERLAEAVVRAPIDGIILQKYVEEGQIIASGVSNVSGGTPIADIADMSSVHIEAGVDEIDIGKIREGQKATVVAEAYPRLEFRGKIVRIAPEAIVEQNVTRFIVIVEVENTDAKLKSGMNANVEIVIVEKRNVLLAPSLAFQETPGRRAKPNKRSVLLKQGDEFVRHKVEIGLADFKQTEIVAGLSEGDILGVPMTSRLQQENERLERRIRSSRSFGK
ncbi:MAG: efflux RND transporter periplasmic adaptor subunit [bacterium]